MIPSTTPKVMTTQASHHYDLIFISPHLDDAVLSGGDFLRNELAQHKKILVVTVFSRFQTSHLSRFAQNFMKECGYHSTAAFGAARRKEDTSALKKLGVSLRHLGLIDGGFRSRPQTNKPVYATELALFNGRIPEFDQQQVFDLLLPILRQLSSQTSHFVAPLGVGRHADHLLCRRAVEAIHSENPQITLSYFVDFPYALKGKNWGWKTGWDYFTKKRQHFPQTSEKRTLVGKYASQLSSLFSGSVIPLFSETILAE